jgi:hypothetical protein
MEELSLVAPRFIVDLPLVLAYLAGIIVSIVLLRRYRPVAFLMLLIALLQLARLLASEIIFSILPIRLMENGWSISRASNLLSGITIVNSFLGAGLWALLLVAVFGWRGQRPAARKRDLPTPDALAALPQAEPSQAIQQKKPTP